MLEPCPLRLVHSIVSGGGEIVSAFVRSDGGERIGDGAGQLGGGSCCSRSEESFDLGKDLLNGIEVGTVGREVENPCTDRVYGA